MSMNLTCTLLLGSLGEVLDLVQTPTDVTYSILGEDTLPWQEVARRYLAWVGRTYPRDVWKSQRKLVGRAWRRADDHGSRLTFDVR